MIKDQEKFDKIIQSLREIAPGEDLNCLVESKETESGMRDLVWGISSAVKLDGADPDALLAELSRQYPASAFWELVGRRVSEDLIPYQETAFLREMEEQQQKKYLSKAFENMVHYQESTEYLCGELGATPEQLESTNKFYNTVIEWAIVHRMSRRQFFAWCEDFFSTGEALTQFLWDLIDANRSMLSQRSIFNVLDSIRPAIGRVNRLLDCLETESAGNDKEEADR